MLPLLEPLLGIALAFNLAYLNLPIFSFLSDTGREVSDLIGNLSDATKKHVEDTPWYKDAVEISRIKNLEKFQFFDSGHLWTPFKSKVCGFLFNVMFKFRVGKLLSLVATVAAAAMIILGVQSQIFPEGEWTKLLTSSVPSPFLVSVSAFVWPIFCVGAGAYIKFNTIRELNYNLRDLGDEAISDAEELIKKAESAINE